jgi:hypothetical protein
MEEFKLNDAIDYITGLRDDGIKLLSQKLTEGSIYSLESINNSLNRVLDLNKQLKVLEDCRVELTVCKNEHLG